MSNYFQTIPNNVLNEIPEIFDYFSEIEIFNHLQLSLSSFQSSFLETLLAKFPHWDQWTASLYSKFQQSPYAPIVINPGLRINQDDELSPLMMLAITKSIFREYSVPFYEVGLPIVTQVSPSKNASENSHSMNLLPAAPHTAGFFEPVPPSICVFACVRPHSFGGAETVVVSLGSILEKLSEEDTETLRNTEYVYTTSKRLGRFETKFKMLTDFQGISFLRYRSNYMVDDDRQNEAQRNALKNLTSLVNDESNWISVPLQSDSILIHWNGCPHGRNRAFFPPEENNSFNEGPQRKLLRCRAISNDPGWSTMYRPVQAKQKLLILDINGILLKRRNGEYAYTPCAKEFIRFCLSNFKLALWSCIRLSKIIEEASQFFSKDELNDMLFIWDRMNCPVNLLNPKSPTIDGKPWFQKQLSDVWRVFPEYSSVNTILLDDEYEKCASNPPESCLVVDSNDDAILAPEGELTHHLRQLAKSKDCAEYNLKNLNPQAFPEKLRSDVVAFNPVINAINIPGDLTWHVENKRKIMLFQRLIDSRFFNNNHEMAVYILWTLGLKNKDDYPNFEQHLEKMVNYVNNHSINSILACLLETMDASIKGAEPRLEHFLHVNNRQSA